MSHIKTGSNVHSLLSPQHHPHALHSQISILQSLRYYEHLAEPMSELLGVLAKEFNYVQHRIEVLREMGREVFGGATQRAPGVFSGFSLGLAVSKQLKGAGGHLAASEILCDDAYLNESWSVIGQRMFQLQEIVHNKSSLG
ncbi:hypothetical protein PILCRDRAFT_8739 [Piloderma croceum F 1598]|uniref:Uncharacterized protein n=1 Tax=Piloderma croceum (strain F 1598) TaxID=765440 RepID=A0A0C3FQB9_PILCF|nr:hypothetical protein PILCRDRAFT_8739 [Piloderma croceum F 1598]